MTTAVIGGHASGAMSYTAFAINNKGKGRALAVAMDKRHPLLPGQRRRMSDLFAALNADPEIKELAAKAASKMRMAL